MKHNAALTALAAASVLGLAACGGGGSSGGTQASPPSHSTSPAPAAAATTQPSGSAMITVPGYDYARLPSGSRNVKELLKSDPKHLKSVSARLVLHDGTMIAALVLVQVKPQYVNLPGVRQAMTSAFVQELTGSGAKVKEQTIHTEPVTIARAGSTVTYCWFHNGAVTVVTGENGHQVHDFVDAYLEAAHA